MRKYIFVSGGVISGLGKGLTAASISLLLKNSGYSVTPIKCENYLNIDSGTINPIEHGDPFLCEDGLEADMDLGTYERLLDMDMGHQNFITKGQIFQKIIEQERSMYYNGEDVEDIPHVIDEIIQRFETAGNGTDFVVVEIGGTAGEYQNVLYFEAARHLKITRSGTVVNVHVTYVPMPKHLGEPKTKPTQMSVRTLMSLGLNPEFLILRSPVIMDEMRRNILGMKSGVPGDNIITAPDLESIYRLPIEFEKQGIHKKILNAFNIRSFRKPDMTDWKSLIRHIEKPKKKNVTVAIVGKYFSKNEGDYELSDAYHALIEAIKHASWYEDIDVDIKFINSNKKSELKKLKDVDGIIVPIGWGKRGVDGKIEAIRYARENKVPYLGLCYGMQLACVEYAQNVLKLRNATSEEINPKARHKIIHSMPFNEKYQVIKGAGTSMRLGAFDCVLKPKTLAYDIYNRHNAFENKRKRIISERHRHRFEFNNDYREKFEKMGFVFSGTSPDDFFVEYIELPKDVHPFFIATQAHPEYKSRPTKPHPVFVELLKACDTQKTERAHSDTA